LGQGLSKEPNIGLGQDAFELKCFPVTSARVQDLAKIWERSPPNVKILRDKQNWEYNADLKG